MLGSLTYQFTPTLSLMFRSGLSNSTGYNDESRFFNTYVIADNGFYNETYNRSLESNSDFLLTFNPSIGKDFSVNALVGGLYRYAKAGSLSSNATPLVNENVFVLSNAAPGGLGSVNVVW